jgi:uncharacterized protein YfaS (alpha-2-macroglobulin family)
MRPVSTVFEQVFIIDSSGSRVNQWLDLDNNNGLISLEFPLSEEPNLGKWTIEAHDKLKNVVTAVFEVKKYVLPKFEVYLDYKKSIIASDEKVNVSVCAK